MSISARRKSVFENRPTGSKIRQTQRRPIRAAALRVCPFGANAAELARRKFLHLAAGAATLPAMSRSAEAQAYPTRPVRLIVGFAPGGLTDIVARIIGQWLSQQLGQLVIIENRTGGTGNIAAQAAINSPADGYTLLLAAASNAINASFYDRLPFNFARDIAPVAGLVSYPLVMVVNPSVAANTVAEFIAYAKANPGKINMASGGVGGSHHLAGELFKVMTGVNMVHVPYRGGEPPALTDMIGGQVQVMFATAPGAIEHIKSGKLRSLAVSRATRWEKLPDIPTIAETVPGYEVSSWTGIGVPRATPPAVIEKLSHEINAGLANPSIKARLTEVGVAPLIVGPADFGKLISNETDKWRKVIRAANIKPE